MGSLSRVSPGKPGYGLGLDNSVGKVSAYNAGDSEEVSLIPGLGRFPWRRKWQPTPVFLPEKSHGQRSLVGYSPWGCQELDMTEQAHILSLQSSKGDSQIDAPPQKKNSKKCDMC